MEIIISRRLQQYMEDNGLQNISLEPVMCKT